MQDKMTRRGVLWNAVRTRGDRGFNFIAPDVKRAEIRELDKLFRLYLRCVIADEDLGQETETRIRNEFADIEYANSNNRSVLGSMNDLVSETGGVHSPEIPGIIRQINRMPMGAISHHYSIDGVREICGVAT